MARTGFIYHDKMLHHDPGRGHPESPARLAAIKQAIEKAKLHPIGIPITPATHHDLARVHTEEHISRIRQTCAENGRYPDPDTQMVQASWQAALLAAGGAISACQAVAGGKIDNAFCAIRPPGHHAEDHRAMGFCLFNNIAIATCWLQQNTALKRIAILDWDVHHGNGTQHTFLNNPGVYYASIHQHPFYPGTGWPWERGAQESNLNIQMPAGAGAAEWIEAVTQQILPEFQRFKPDFLLISAGFDAHHRDPIGGQRLKTETFAQMTHLAKGIAHGRLVSLLEGGYHLEALGDCAVAHIQALQDGAHGVSESEEPHSASGETGGGT